LSDDITVIHFTFCGADQSKWQYYSSYTSSIIWKSINKQIQS